MTAGVKLTNNYSVVARLFLFSLGYIKDFIVLFFKLGISW